MKLSELIANGYETQARKLAAQLQKNRESQKFEEAREWMKLGATVNYSFYEQKENPSYSTKEIIAALKDLGIEYGQISGKKWFEFWKDNDEIKLLNAIKSL